MSTSQNTSVLQSHSQSQDINPQPIVITKRPRGRPRKYPPKLKDSPKSTIVKDRFITSKDIIVTNHRYNTRSSKSLKIINNNNNSNSNIQDGIPLINLSNNITTSNNTDINTSNDISNSKTTTITTMINQPISTPSPIFSNMNHQVIQDTMISPIMNFKTNLINDSKVNPLLSSMSTLSNIINNDSNTNVNNLPTDEINNNSNKNSNNNNHYEDNNNSNVSKYIRLSKLKKCDPTTKSRLRNEIFSRSIHIVNDEILGMYYTCSLCDIYCKNYKEMNSKCNELFLTNRNELTELCDLIRSYILMFKKNFEVFEGSEYFNYIKNNINK